MNNFINYNPILQSLIATTFTFLITSFGASIVFFFKKVNKTIMDFTLGISAGVMIAASFFSLLNPAIKMAETLSMNTWLVLFIGVTFGGILLYVTSIIVERLLKKNKKSKSLKRSLMLVLSIVLHNVPEGMAIGVAFASTIYNIEGATINAAILLTIGIGIQNFPEGSAISLPLRREGYSRTKAFIFGSLSGIVEIFAGVIGAILVLKIRYLLPYLLSFAAGAMIYVVIEELIPESQSNQNNNLMSLFTLIGFSIMMILDVALG